MRLKPCALEMHAAIIAPRPDVHSNALKRRPVNATTITNKRKSMRIQAIWKPHMKFSSWFSENSKIDSISKIQGTARDGKLRRSKTLMHANVASAHAKLKKLSRTVL